MIRIIPGRLSIGKILSVMLGLPGMILIMTGYERDAARAPAQHPAAHAGRPRARARPRRTLPRVALEGVPETRRVPEEPPPVRGAGELPGVRVPREVHRDRKSTRL